MFAKQDINQPTSYFKRYQLIFEMGMYFNKEKISIISFFFIISMIITYNISKIIFFESLYVWIPAYCIILYSFLYAIYIEKKYTIDNVKYVMPDQWYEDVFKLDEENSDFKNSITKEAKRYGYITLDVAQNLTEKYYVETLHNTFTIQNKIKKDAFVGIGKFLQDKEV